MPPKLGQSRTVVATRTRTVEPRTTRIQTSGVFKLPFELLLEVFSYLADHRSFIREHYYGRELNQALVAERKYAERSTVIRRLTMTCWPLRNLLLPLLWADAEGFIHHSWYNYETGTGGLGSDLYAQCVYLTSNPAIAAYVQTFSVRLHFLDAPEGLVAKFFNCLARLPNLRTLEILDVTSRSPIPKVLKRKRARFPSIRELRITATSHHFIMNCPNLESLTFTTGLDMDALATVRLHCKGLKRIAGVDVYCPGGLRSVCWGCPNLREVCIVGSTQFSTESIDPLRWLKHLAVVDVDLEEGQDYEPPIVMDWEKARKVWKGKLIGFLKDSPSTDRKVLRWRISHSYRGGEFLRWRYHVVENEELEVSREILL